MPSIMSWMVSSPKTCSNPHPYTWASQRVSSCVWLSATPWTGAHQDKFLCSMEFSRQEYWSGLPFPIPGDLSDPRNKPMSLVSPALVGGFFTAVPLGKSLQSWTYTYHMTPHSLSYLPWVTKSYTHTQNSTWMIITTLFITTKIWNNPNTFQWMRR